jgi:IclR family KDG regulon transcriptional repressor
VNAGENGPGAPKRIKSVAKAVAVLRQFARGDDLSLAEIARAVHGNPSSVYHLVRTLVDEHVLEQDPATRKYRLGPALLSIVSPSMRSSAILAVAEEHLYRCAQQTGFDAWIGVLESDRVYYIARVDGANPLKLHMPLLRLQPAHCVSAGRVLLSGFSRDRVRRVLSQHTIRIMTPRTCTDMDAVLDSIELAARQGYAEVEDEHIQGASDIAVPIHGESGVVLAAVSIGAPSHVFGHETRLRVLGPMEECARAIESALATRTIGPPPTGSTVGPGRKITP